MDPDADKARAFFRQKKRALINKVMPLKDAIGHFVQDGFYLGIGGFGAVLPRISTGLPAGVPGLGVGVINNSPPSLAYSLFISARPT